MAGETMSHAFDKDHVVRVLTAAALGLVKREESSLRDNMYVPDHCTINGEKLGDIALYLVRQDYMDWRYQPDGSALCFVTRRGKEWLSSQNV